MNKSILQNNEGICYLCGMNRNLEPLDKHHIFGGACRALSEKYGLYVFLHHQKCHIFGKDSVHQNNKIRFELCRIAQEKAIEKYGWTVEEFIKIFGRNYLEGKE